MIRRSLRRACDFLAAGFGYVGRRIYESPMEQRVRPWFADRGDDTLRQQYDLDATSLVIDAGGYRGQWTSDIVARYRCKVIVFEPIPAFADRIRERFRGNPNVVVETAGLAATDGQASIAVDADASSACRDGGRRETITLVAIDRYLREQKIAHVDLIKINIEGGEYDLLEHVLASGMIGTFRDLQIQFHDFVPQAAERMKAIQDKLTQTHRLTYQYPFIWENWRRRE